MFEDSPISWAFVGVACLGILTPGPDLLFVLSKGLGQGRKAALLGTAGIGSGLLVHMAIAAAGLLALVAMSKYAFLTLQVVGALYLSHLGIRALKTSNILKISEKSGQESCLKSFMSGFWVNLLNPKFILFNFAFLPRFVRLEKGEIGWQTLQLGICNLAFAMMIFSIVSICSSMMNKFLYERPRVMKAINCTLGFLFLGLSLQLFYLLFTNGLQQTASI